MLIFSLVMSSLPKNKIVSIAGFGLGFISGAGACLNWMKQDQIQLAHWHTMYRITLPQSSPVNMTCPDWHGNTRVLNYN